MPSIRLPFREWRDHAGHLWRNYRSWRWIGRLLFALALFWGLIWFFFARGLPSADALLAYQPPLPTNVRAYDGEPIADFARERRVELSYQEYPQLLVHAFISAEDKASTSAASPAPSSTIPPSWAAAGARGAAPPSPSRWPRT
jgi:penicillin-binding protein 1A